MEKKVRLGVIGTGMAWERLHWPALKNMQDKYSIVAFANPTIEKAQKAADEANVSYENVYSDYKEMLQREDIDAVDVLVPISLNYTISKEVLKAHKHLICEKPLAKNMNEAEDFLNLVKKQSSLVMIAENFRYNEENNIIKNMISEGRIGDILYFVKNNMSDFKQDMIGNTFAAKEWRQHPEFEGGAFLDGGVHDIAAFRHIFGNITAVSAFGRKNDDEYCPYSNIHCNLFFDSAVVGNYTYCSVNTEAQSPPIGFRIYGTKGNIYLEDKSCGIINIFYNDGGHEAINYTPKKGFENEFINFYQAFNQTEEISVTPSIEFGDAEVIYSLLKSAKKMKTIELDKDFRYVVDLFLEKVNV
jgi:predicted dehydrogenase